MPEVLAWNLCYAWLAEDVYKQGLGVSKHRRLAPSLAKGLKRARGARCLFFLQLTIKASKFALKRLVLGFARPGRRSTHPAHEFSLQTLG